MASNPISSATSTATDFYALLASAVSAATSRDPLMSSNQARDLSNSGTLIPPTVHGTDRLSFIAAQRERLSILLTALDKEASTLQSEVEKPSPRSIPNMFFDGGSGSEGEAAGTPLSGLSTRKSELDFEKIDAESGTEETENNRRQVSRGQTASGSWLPWSWGAKNEHSLKDDDVTGDTMMTGTSKDEDKGKSSGIDA